MAGIILNPFTSDAFTSAMLTESMIRLPYNQYSLLGDMGLFQEEGIPTTSVIVEEMGGSLTILPTVPRGAPSLVNNIGRRKVRSFAIPHYGLDDIVQPSEAQGIREFGSQNELRNLASVMARKLQTMKNKHDQTLEWQRVGALKGILLEADGTTVIYNWFTEFGISARVITFPLSNSSLDVNGTVLNVSRYVEDNLHGERMSGIMALCAPDFFSALVAHPNVQKAFQFFMTTQPLGYDYRNGFTFGGITFREYRGTASDITGVARQFIANGTCQFFPLGTTSMFRTYFAPADFNETVNTLGLPYYAKQAPVKFDRGTEVHTQSNPLSICLRPELLVQGQMS